jgi:hypothetical protein
MFFITDKIFIRIYSPESIFCRDAQFGRLYVSCAGRVKTQNFASLPTCCPDGPDGTFVVVVLASFIERLIILCDKTIEAQDVQTYANPLFV